MPWIASLLILLCIARISVQMVGTFRHPSPMSTAPSVAIPPVRKQVDVNGIANAHLFGMLPVAGNDANAPDSTLALKLDGIVAGPDPETSRALITENGDEEPYAIGTKLPGGAVIRGIYADRVVLERNGQLEALRLPQHDLAAITSYTTPVTMGGSGSQTVLVANVTQPTDLSTLRQEILDKPSHLLELIRVMPAMSNGMRIGYRVFPGNSQDVLTSLGLQPGDVVTAVNDLPLTNSGGTAGVLASLKTSEQLRIAFVRDGRQQNKTLQLNERDD